MPGWTEIDVFTFHRPVEDGLGPDNDVVCRRFGHTVFDLLLEAFSEIIEASATTDTSSVASDIPIYTVAYEYQRNHDWCDWDFNDVIVEYENTIEVNSSDYVTSLSITATLVNKDCTDDVQLYLKIPELSGVSIAIERTNQSNSVYSTESITNYDPDSDELMIFDVNDGSNVNTGDLPPIYVPLVM